MLYTYLFIQKQEYYLQSLISGDKDSNTFYVELNYYVLNKQREIVDF